MALTEDPHWIRLRDQAERLMLQGQAPEAEAVNREAREVAPGVFGLRLQRVRILIRLRDMPAARADFRAAMDHAERFLDYHMLFELNPEVFDFWERVSNWLELRPRVLRLADTGPDFTDAIMLAARLCLALRDYEGFLAQLGRIPPIPGHGLYEVLWKTATFLQRRRFPDYSRPKVFGIGLSKTGTTSLDRALSQLGYHAMHFINPVTCEVLKLEDAFLSDAMTDTPVCTMFETLFHMFPNSKFVYTVRKREEWESSFSNHYQRNYRSSGFDDIRTSLFTRAGATRGQERAPIYASLLAAHEEAFSAYHAFDVRVRHFFSQAPSRLLEMDIAGGDGWAKLCPFLGRPIPKDDFPWRNKTA